MCGETLKPLHLHNPSMQRRGHHGGGRPLRKRLTLFTVFLYHASYLPTALVTGPNYLLLPTHVFCRG